jgi:hypothetical protein
VAEGPTGHGALTVKEQLTCGVLPLFQLLPQYYAEAGAQYLPREAALRQLRVSADHAGRLVRADGSVMARGAETLGIFVLDYEGVLMVSLDFSDVYTRHDSAQGGVPPLHHSSMVAGAAVAAAGQIGLRDGRVCSLSNESGHYMPPPSCLHTVLTRLAELGAAPLNNVRIDTVFSPLTQRDATGTHAALAQLAPQRCTADRLVQPIASRPHVSPVRPRPRTAHSLMPADPAKKNS